MTPVFYVTSTYDISKRVPVCPQAGLTTIAFTAPIRHVRSARSSVVAPDWKTESAGIRHLALRLCVTYTSYDSQTQNCFSGGQAEVSRFVFSPISSSPLSFFSLSFFFFSPSIFPSPLPFPRSFFSLSFSSSPLSFFAYPFPPDGF